MADFVVKRGYSSVNCIHRHRTFHLAAAGHRKRSLQLEGNDRGKMPVLESTSDQKYQHQLPTVVFRVVDDKALTVPAGVSSVSLSLLIARIQVDIQEQSRSYGCELSRGSGGSR